MSRDATGPKPPAGPSTPPPPPGPKAGTDLVRIPFHGGVIEAVLEDDRPKIVLRPAFTAMGLDADRQILKLRSQEWATTSVTAVVAEDGKVREMVVSDVRTFLMALATIPASRVSATVRPLLVAYQREVADVIERHFTQQGSAYEPAPFTWTFDETCAILRQRYNIRYNVVTLRAAMISAGLLKQVGTPRADFEACFHFTGSAWTVHPHMLKRVALRLARLQRSINASYDEQLALEGVGAPEVSA